MPSVFQLIREFISAGPEVHIGPECALGDLGIDSLAIMSLTEEIEEEFGVTLPNIGPDTTIRVICDEIAEQL